MNPTEQTPDGLVGKVYGVKAIYQGEEKIADFLEGIKKGAYNDENVKALQALITQEVKKELEHILSLSRPDQMRGVYR